MQKFRIRIRPKNTPKHASDIVPLIKKGAELSPAFERFLDFLGEKIAGRELEKFEAGDPTCLLTISKNKDETIK